MQQKYLLRRKYYSLRKKKYYEIDKNFFSPFVDLIKFKVKKNLFNLALYYPSSFEINVLKILELNFISKKNLLLPIIEKNNLMNFFPWKKNDTLLVNKYGMLEPIKSKQNIPDIMLVPLLAFDKDKYRLGYGKGFYDRYLNRYLKKFKNILTIGVAFSFQKYHKLPVNNKDVKLNYILTEKGIY
jgi:5-formyltetrahydrofolate cyclo-ligase|tara:strand:- start:167 stop:718 length:552 start_codon:yes stop_codon:yes gene_type:complete